MIIRDLFLSDVTRDIAPVVYFHEQSPEKLAGEVSEYIITGGWPEDHPHHRRVPDGIHEQYVRLLKNITDELDKSGGPELPTAWISGFYGSGKSSFAKLLGLAIDGVALPDGTSLTEAWLQRDRSPKAAELREAWRVLRQKIEPLAVVFDIGAVARDNEHIHTATVRQVQRRLGYCSTEPLVADFELSLERDGEWARFERIAEKSLGAPWSDVKDKALAEEDFSVVMSAMYPDRYTDPMSWFTSRGGTHTRSASPDEAVAAIRDMIKFRRPRATVFLIVDEVSNYVLSNKDRVDRLRAFATSIGSTLRGKAWLLALGQQKLEDEADDTFLIWAKDRFPPKLRVHLAPTNIRDVVHKRLLEKKPEVEAQLRSLFEKNRPDLKLFGYGCEHVTSEDFVEVYPLLPGQIDLILQITSALRTRSARAQGDDQAIRGLLQLLGELFRSQKLADKPIESLVTIDQIYEVQHTALDADVQASMARILSQCHDDANGLMVRSAKAVALLELLQDTVPTNAKLIAKCLYDRVDCGNQLPAITEALGELRRRNLLGYSEKHGYKIQSSAGEEWERERRDIGVAREAITDIVHDRLTYLLGMPERPRLQGRPFPWAGVFSDGRRANDVVLADPRDEAALCVDFRFLSREERTESNWIRRSAETSLSERLVWVSGDTDRVDELARDLHRSQFIVKKYTPRRESLNATRKLLLQQEEIRGEELEKQVSDAVAAAWMAGKMYFRGRSISPQEHGSAFAAALNAAANRILPDLFPYIIATQVLPAELMQLVESELSGPSTKFLTEALGILELDAGRYVPACNGVVPRRVQEHVENEGGLAGTTLLAHFVRPPYGYTANVVKACIAGLLRGGKVRIQPEGGNEITAIRDAGVRDLFEGDRAFRRSTIFPSGEDDIGPQARARICKFFDEQIHHRMDREDHAIADAVSLHFPPLAQKLRTVEDRLKRLPGSSVGPEAFRKLEDALEQCTRAMRQTKPTVKLVKKNLDVLRDGVQLLQIYDSELTADAVRDVNNANDVLTYHAAQLEELRVEPTDIKEARARVKAHLDSERPWRDIAGLDHHLQKIRATYAEERQRLLQWQEQQAEHARARLKGRDGFSTLTADQSHQVLRPLASATTNTTANAVAPTLAALKDPFTLSLTRAQDHANEILDQILTEGNKPLITRIDLGLRNREIKSEPDIDALVSEIKTRLLEPIRAGGSIRLL
jgi:hypothetical protein